uniref:triacylglycerol lipase n=1 Tax=Yarrowia lipolytica TaxID=4952 RepID=I0CKU9_YARLL|nr:lipase 11 [Yarrowia lipolytica]
MCSNQINQLAGFILDLHLSIFVLLMLQYSSETFLNRVVEGWSGAKGLENPTCKVIKRSTRSRRNSPESWTVSFSFFFASSFCSFSCFAMLLSSLVLSALSLVSVTAQNVVQATQDTWDLINYAEHLSSLAICGEPYGVIYKPFQCAGRCSDFPDMELITQFTPQDPLDFSVSGFLAVDHKRKVFWHVFRGTATLNNGLTDLRIKRQPLTSWNTAKMDCPDCQVHVGFLQAYNLAYSEAKGAMDDTFAKYPDYQVIVTGHSLGGAATFLHGINLKTSGYDPLVITSGQPLTGNKALADYNDKLFFGDNPDFTHQGPDRRFYRVTHKEDIVPRIPFWTPYHQSGGEVYIDFPGINPPVNTLKVCDGQQNPLCSFSTSLASTATQGIVEAAHLIYFTFFFLCSTLLYPPLNSDLPVGVWGKPLNGTI